MLAAARWRSVYAESPARFSSLVQFQAGPPIFAAKAASIGKPPFAPRRLPVDHRVMDGAPAAVDPVDLKELHIRITKGTTDENPKS